MCLKIMAIIFIISVLCMVGQMVLLDLGITKKISPMRASDFVSTIAISLSLYIISALILAIMIPGKTRYIMLFLAVLPFITGMIAQYNTYKIFTKLQNVIMVCGIIYLGKILFFIGA